MILLIMFEYPDLFRLENRSFVHFDILKGPYVNDPSLEAAIPIQAF